MKNSTELNQLGYCHSNNKVDTSRTNNNILKAVIQKDIILRSLKGERINDIPAELDSLFSQKKVLFENYNQKKSAITLYAVRDAKYLRYALSRPGRYEFPDKEDCVINYRGEDIEVKTDCVYLNDNNNSAELIRIRTGRASTNAQNRDKKSLETEALIMLGKKLYPDRNISVVYHYLADHDSKTEKQNIREPYEYRGHKILEVEDTLKNREAWAKSFNEAKQPCSPEDCASCGNYNICHYEEPPISVGTDRVIRPISDLHLTSAQRDVINFDNGIARVNAGAGAGKTLVVALRVKKLIEKGYDPSKICLLTFTKTGALEMTDRVTNYLAADGILLDPENEEKSIVSSTINSFCQDIINEHYEELGYTSQPRVVPDEVKSGIVNRILDVYPTVKEWNYGMATTGYRSYVKNALTTAKIMFSEINTNGYTYEDNPYRNDYRYRYSEESLFNIFTMCDEYNKVMKSRNLMDFDDQLKNVFKLVELNPNLFDEYGYEHIIVDEFQDTDKPQIDLLNTIIENHAFKSFMAVGDDSQSIFAFRNTSPEYIINFRNYFGAFEDFNLVENHRSDANIINYANKVNELSDERVDKDLIATREDGVPVKIEGFYTQKKEYEYVAHQIADRVAQGEDPSSIAFLASDKYELQAMASELTKLGVPSILMNPIPFKMNSRVSALCNFYDSFMKGTTQGMLEYDNALRHGGLKNASKEELEAIINERKSMLESTPRTVEKFLELAKNLDMAEVDECYQEFLDKISYCKDMDEMTEFFNDFELYGNDSAYRREGHYDGVCLITVHSAKGMEWDTTYLSLSKFDNVNYHNNPSRNHSQLNEAYRKWFVGTTRARKNLIMTGQYVLKHDMRQGVVLNDFLRKGYELNDKVYGFNSASYIAELEAEKMAENPLMGANPTRLANEGQNIRQAQNENTSADTVSEPER